MKTTHRSKAPQYRRLLAEAWQTTRQRQRLWIFGIFAAAMMSGGVLDVTLRGFKRVMRLSELLDQMLEGTIPGFGVFAQYVRQFPLLDETRVMISFVLLIVTAVVLLAATVLGQSMLLVAAADKRPRPFGDVLARSWPTFFPVLVTDLAVKLCLALATLLTSLPLVLFIFESTLLNAALYVASFLLFFPAVMAVNSVGMLTVVGLVRGKRHPADAFHDSLALFRKHWLPILELAVVLFAVSLGAGFAATAVLIALTVPYTILTAVVLLTSSQPLYLLSMGLASLVFIAVILFSAGLVTAFQYVVWLRFYELARRPGIVSKLQRWWNR